MSLYSRAPGSMILLVLLVALISGAAMSLMRGNAAYASGVAPSPTSLRRPTLVPPREPLTPTPQPLLDPELLCLQLVARQEMQSSGSVVSYDIVVRNMSHTVRALRPVVSVPVGLQQGVEIVALPSGAWVREAQDAALQVALPSLAPSAALTMTVRMPLLDRIESMLTRVSIDWSNRRASVPATLSNQVLISLTDVRGPVEGGILTLYRSAEGLSLVGAGFTSYERVGLWYDHPDGRTVALRDTIADSQGMMRVPLSAELLPALPGDIVAYGTCSQQWLVGRATP